VNFEWLKKHPYVAAAGGLVLLIVFYLIFRSSSSSSGSSLTSAISQQNQGQLQMAELNAQLSSQSDQEQAQLAASEYDTQASEQEEQDQTAGALAEELVPEELESTLGSQELADEYGLAEQGVNLTMLGGSGQTGQDVRNAGLTILGEALGEGGTTSAPSSSGGININLGSLGSGLFG
jgi:hypothetical protein